MFKNSLTQGVLLLVLTVASSLTLPFVTAFAANTSPLYTVCSTLASVECGGNQDSYVLWDFSQTSYSLKSANQWFASIKESARVGLRFKLQAHPAQSGFVRLADGSCEWRSPPYWRGDRRTMPTVNELDACRHQKVTAPINIAAMMNQK